MSDLRQQQSRHRLAILIATTFFLLATTYSVVTPIFEAPDELWHYPFVWHLARTWRLPVQDPAHPQLWQQEGSQAPLYYILAAVLTALIPANDLPTLIYRNPQADVGLVSADGNANVVVHTGQEAWPWRGAVLAIHLARLLSVLLSTGTVLTVYALGRILRPERISFGLLAMSFVAFNPMFLFISGSVNNDNLITLLASLTVWRLVSLTVACPEESRGVQGKAGEPSIWQFVSLGVLVGLAALAKVSGLSLLGLVGVTLLWWGFRWRSWRTALLGNSLVVLPAVVIAGWWYWRNLVLYGDFTGTENMVAIMGPRPIVPTVGYLLAEGPGVLRSFWGLFGYLSVPMPSPVYGLFNLVLATGLVGLLAAFWPGQSDRLPPRLKRALPILLIWPVLLATGWLQFTLRTPASQGRLLFPLLAALATLWAAGWMAWLPPRLQVLPVLPMLMVAVWVPWGVIIPAYARPAPVAALPPSIHRLDVTFGQKIHLLGYESRVTAVQPGQSLPLTLYWRGEKPVETDYIVFVHLLDEDNLIIAQRDVFHGPGVYPTSQWTAGELFADTYVLRIPGTALAPNQAHFEVGLYDPATGARLPASTGGDNIHFGRVLIEPQPGELPNPQALLFEDDIALVGYALDRRRVAAGETVTLTLYWQAHDTPGDDYKVFVHLVGRGETRVAQHDSEPQHGAAPTSGWGPGQIVVDEHPLQLAPGTPPDAYRLVVGLYEGDTGRRLRLLRDRQESVQADSVTLGGIRVIP